MERIDDLISGQVISNKELTSIFGCSSQGGMRKSNKTNSLVIVSNHVKSIYDDRWEGDILLYTGMGVKGDQSFDFMQNKTLCNSCIDHVDVYLFEVFVEKQYTYIGKVELAKEPFFENQPDSNNKIRKVCVFPVRIIDDKFPAIEKEALEKNTIIKSRRVRKIDDNTLFSLAKRGERTPGFRYVKTMRYDRNEAVAEYAKRIAKGICQLCGEKAPFNYKDGAPYLETHHINWLSEGGSDTIDNTVALCPNCHAKMHIVDDEKDREYLRKMIKEIIDK